VKPVHFVCVSLILAGTIAQAQFAPPPLASQANARPYAQEPQPGLPPNLFHLPQGVPIAQRQRGRSRLRRAKPQAQNGPEQVLYAFQGGNDGAGPIGDLIFDSSGNLYGTTGTGGGTDCNCGTVFELSPNGSGGWTETILHSFQGGSDGSGPSAGLIFDQAGNLYGTTFEGGGVNHLGTVFELSPSGNGGWTETILYRFEGVDGGPEGPQGVTFDQKGNLYGTAQGGQSDCGPFDSACGTVFELSPNGSGGWTETLIFSFPFPGHNGYAPNPGLILDGAGNLYGTNQSGGLGPCYSRLGCGTAFELSPNTSGDWTEAVLYSFSATSGGGTEPAAGLIFDQSGNLYGTAYLGGTGCDADCGTVFELSPNGTGGWTETTLHSFQGGSDGGNPVAGLNFDKNGNLYGSTLHGGPYGYGTVFELSPNGSGGWIENVLLTFLGGSEGMYPYSGLILDPDDNLYGTTSEGGVTGCGCGLVYELIREPFVAFSPTSLSFPNQTVGVSSSPQTTTLTNSGSLPLTITSIQITGADSGDFGQTNNCPSSLQPNNSCTISVTFTPIATGSRSAAVSVTDNAPGSPQSVPLTGVGTPASVTLSPPSLSFAQILGTTSQSQTIQLSASYAISITSIEASAEFGQTNNCGKGLPPGGKCQILVTFAPTTSGTQSGTLTINDSGADSPQTAALSGTGQDFSLAPSVSSTQTVAPGQVANYALAVAPLGGFNRTVTLTCSGAPAQSTCSVSPNSVTLNGTTTASVAVTVATTGTSASLTRPSSFPRAGNHLALWLAFSGLPGLVLLSSRPRKRHGRVFFGAIFLCMLFLLMTMSACGGGNGMGGSGGSATPAGTYNLTVAGTFTSGSANLVHSTKLTLVVQ
jgi:uncharacterized repeat protein (TIGR03803 family)